MKVDYILTYNDPSDKIWLQSMLDSGGVINIINKDRFDCNGVIYLKYAIRGIAKYLPWINNLYLCVSSKSQVPEWINQSVVKVVLHEEFIPHEFLPTFNSTTIEMFIQNIPGIEEHTLIAADDIFPINNIPITYFFDEYDNPKTEGKYKFNNEKFKQTREKSKTTWDKLFVNTCEFAKRITGHENDDWYFNYFKHTPVPVRLDIIRELYDKNRDAMNDTITKFRDGRNLGGTTLWKLVNTWLFDGVTSIKCLERQWQIANEEQNVLEMHENGIHIFNMNANELGDFFVNQFEQIFPCKCKYEV